jgi:hypothetical protein
MTHLLSYYAISPAACMFLSKYGYILLDYVLSVAGVSYRGMCGLRTISLRKTAVSFLLSTVGKASFKSDRNRRLFPWRLLEAGQYVAQSGLHLHLSEPYSFE